MDIGIGIVILLCVVAAAVGLLIGGVIATVYHRNVSDKKLNSAEAEAKRILNDAIKTAESKQREAMVEAKEAILAARNEWEQQEKERRAAIQQQETRLEQKEENLDKKTENLEKKDEALQEKLAALEQTKEEIEDVKQKQMAELERISGMTAEEAKDMLVSQLEAEVTHESAAKIKEAEAHYKEEADSMAREIISLAIQRCASDHVAEATVSVVALPSDDMKGRIIGREGRNIRTLETLTGVDLIIDDTPEAITVSCFDPVRREIARIALEKLIQDGRIHPARIEEMVEKAKREVDATIKAEGERTVFEANVHGLHPELVKLLGRMKYRTSYGQNVLSHSLEVSHLAGLMASELGGDVAVAKRAGRLHHNDVEPKTLVAVLVQAADAVSAARPGARRENLENYIKRLETLEGIGSSFPGVEKCFAIQAGREIRIMVEPDKVSEDQMVLLARDVAKKIEDEMEYPGQIKVNIIRETKAVDYAK